MKKHVLITLATLLLSQSVYAKKNVEYSHPQLLNIPDKWIEVKQDGVNDNCSEAKWDEYGDRYKECITKYWKYTYDKNNNLKKIYKNDKKKVRLQNY